MLQIKIKTPETDEACFTLRDYNPSKNVELVTADFARKLERRITHLKSRQPPKPQYVEKTFQDYVNIGVAAKMCGCKYAEVRDLVNSGAISFIQRVGGGPFKVSLRDVKKHIHEGNYITVKEAAITCQINATTIYTLIRGGKISSQRDADGVMLVNPRELSQAPRPHKSVKIPEAAILCECDVALIRTWLRAGIVKARKLKSGPTQILISSLEQAIDWSKDLIDAATAARKFKMSTNALLNLALREGIVAIKAGYGGAIKFNVQDLIKLMTRKKRKKAK